MTTGVTGDELPHLLTDQTHLYHSLNAQCGKYHRKPDCLIKQVEYNNMKEY